ncbi:MAG TPA: hypothetical protein VIF64_22760 [Pyrinomonadaceae bacterium]|jgi:hypothetical protein
MKRVVQILILATCTVAFASLANAQATRTWVSGVGDDANPCSRTAPCKTFAGAISKTFINGEINCLDPGGYGTVTITKSITIDCEDTQGSILASGTNGISVNLGASNVNDPLRTVRIRGLSINGAGAQGAVGTRTGLRGINVNTGNTVAVTVFVEEVIIQNFVNEGILFNAAGGTLVVNDSEIIGCANAGVRTLSTTAGAAGVIHVTIDNLVSTFNQQGVRFEGNTKGTIKNTNASNNTLNGFVCFPTSIGGAEMNITDSEASDNLQFGVFSGGTGQTATVRIFNLTAFNNTTNQLSVNAGGSILSNGKNHIGTPTNAPGVFTDQ